jgi:hypothetical protein
MIDIFYNRQPTVIVEKYAPEFVNDLINELLDEGDLITNKKCIKNKLILTISHRMLEKDYSMHLNDLYVKTKTGRLFKIIFNEHKEPLIVKKLSEVELHIDVNVYECCNRDSWFFPLIKRWTPVRNTNYNFNIYWK